MLDAPIRIAECLKGWGALRYRTSKDKREKPMSHFEDLQAAVAKTLQDRQTGTFAMILEDDFVARVYFNLLEGKVPAYGPKVFLKTRIFQEEKTLPKRNKYDLVIGSVRDVVVDGRDTRDVTPDLIAEFKVFPVGFHPQQLSNRRKGIIEDIDKLELVASVSKNRSIKYVVVFYDEIGWLNRNNRRSTNSRLDEATAYLKSKGKVHLLGVLDGKIFVR